MTGVCGSCGERQRVPSTRGSRMADFRCRFCGGELHGVTKGRNTGVKRTKVKCVVCGRNRLSPSNAVKTPDQPFELSGYSRSTAEWSGDQVGPFEAGSPVCWHHDIALVAEAVAP